MNHVADMRGSGIRSVTAANPPSYNATPTIPFLNGDVPAGVAISAIAALLALSVTPPLLVCPSAFCLSALTPPLAALIFFLLRVTNANLRPTIWSDAKLKRRLSH